jgi:hypothetical protein
MTNSAHLTPGVTLLHNMSAPSRTTITFQAPADRPYGHGVIIALRDSLPKLTPARVLRLLQKDPPAKQAEIMLKKLIEARAQELPLPPAVAISSQARSGDTSCEDLLTIVTILAKSSSRVYLRDKSPNLESIVAGRRLVLIVPKEIRL